MIVSFESSLLTVAEGETGEIGVRYSIRNLPNPLTVMVSPLDGTTTPDDYKLTSMSVQLPAAQEVTGIATLPLIASRDNLLSEGDETLLLRMVPREGVQTPLGQELSITITDTHATACSGVEVLASPPIEKLFRIPGAIAPTYSTQIQLRLEAHAPRVWFEWESYLPPNTDSNRYKVRVFVLDWRIESSGDTTNHSMDVRWYGERGSSPDRLRLRSPDGACEGEPSLVCTIDGCELES